MDDEEGDDIRLRRAKEALAHSREAENEARRELSRCIEQTAASKKRYEDLFLECEKHAVQRNKAKEFRADMNI